MKQPKREDLLGYMLGALDAPETQQVEEFVKNHPDVQTELESIESTVALLEHLETPPASNPGLARRTVEYVAGKSRPTELTAVVEPTPGSGWSVSDILVGAIALVVLAAVGIPTINYARFNSQMVSCQNNLRQVGNALFTYQENSPTNSFVSISVCPDDPMNVAGSYAPILKDAGLVENENWFFCGGVDHNDRIAIPSIDQISQARGPKLAEYQRSMGGDYGYNLGYYDQGRYMSPRNQRRSNFAILSDKPSISLPGRQSRNHGGKGQNVWFEDGHIAFLSQPLILCGGGSDAIFENESGNCGPGTCCSDICIGSSSSSPIKQICPSQLNPINAE